MSDYTPAVANVRAVRKFKMGDTDLGGYITLAEESALGQEVCTTGAITASGSVTAATQRKHMLALLAAHLATALREPEPSRVAMGQVQMTWDRAIQREALKSTTPGAIFADRWERYNRPDSRFIR